MGIFDIFAVYIKSRVFYCIFFTPFYFIDWLISCWCDKFLSMIKFLQSSYKWMQISCADGVCVYLWSPNGNELKLYDFNNKKRTCGIVLIWKLQDVKQRWQINPHCVTQLDIPVCKFLYWILYRWLTGIYMRLCHRFFNHLFVFKRDFDYAFMYDKCQRTEKLHSIMQWLSKMFTWFICIAPSNHTKF